MKDELQLRGALSDLWSSLGKEENEKEQRSGAGTSWLCMRNVASLSTLRNLSREVIKFVLILVIWVIFPVCKEA